MMAFEIISTEALDRRSHWVAEIGQMRGEFGSSSAKVEHDLEDEIKKAGIAALTDHLRMCGAIPESYGHDSSEEKLYSKYTDVLLAIAFRAIGLNSLVLAERADAADVEAVGPEYSFVADAKAFRLSRTAKNQKDFKIQALDGWKRGKPFALLVCPLYQLPVKSSQIYQQAAARNVCIISYSHLAVVTKCIVEHGKNTGQDAIGRAFCAVAAMGLSKDAGAYWTALNNALFSNMELLELWRTEKIAMLESISAAKEESLTVLSQQREVIMRLSHKEALQRLINVEKLENRIQAVSNVSGDGLLGY